MDTPRPERPITLHRFVLSGHCHRVELFLRLLDLPYRTVDVDLAHGEHKRAEFLALNPFGQVPVIDDDGVVLFDSNAILVYLALRYAAESHWLPRDPLGAARVQRWLSAAAGPLASGAATARLIQLFGLQRDASEAIERGHQLFRIIENTLVQQDSPFITGAEATLADIALYSYTAHAPEGKVSLDDYPALRAWLKRIEALPRFTPMPPSRVGPAV